MFVHCSCLFVAPQVAIPDPTPSMQRPCKSVCVWGAGKAQAGSLNIGARMVSIPGATPFSLQRVAADIPQIEAALTSCVSGAKVMPIVPQSEIQVKLLDVNFKETDEKYGQKFGEIFRCFSISREIGSKKFHTNSSTHQDLKFHTAEPKFFHSDTLVIGGPTKVWAKNWAKSWPKVPEHFRASVQTNS